MGLQCSAALVLLLSLRAPPSLAAKGSWQWHLPPGQRAAASSALIKLRVDRALDRARQTYAAGRFATCANHLTQVEAPLSRLQGSTRDLRVLKRLNLWIGLCRAVNAPAAARRSFELAARLPGDAPDPDIFPPKVLRLYHAAQRRGGGCRLRVDGWNGPLDLDGRNARAGDEVTPGEHYVRWGGQAARRAIGADCQLALSAQPRPTTPLLTAEELTDSGFLRALGLSTGLELLVLSQAGATGPERRTFQVASGRFVPPPAPTTAPPPSSVAARPAPPAAARVDLQLSSPGPTAAPRPGSGPRPWYLRWWALTLGAAVVATAVAVPLVLTRPEHHTTYEVGF